MTQEKKQLLLKDLCGRLPYGVIVDYKENEFESPHWKITTIYPETLDGWISYDKKVGAGSESGSRPFDIGEFKPYLRSMSSMTEKETYIFRQDVLNEVEARCIHSFGSGEYSLAFTEANDWLNVHHFDYRGLIEKGLALEAPEGMYKNE